MISDARLSTTQERKIMSDQAEHVPFDISASQIRAALLTGRKTVYDLSLLLGWTNGKTARAVNRMIDNGDIFSKEEMRNGRGIKIVSLTPFEETELEHFDDKEFNDLVEVCSVQNDIIKKIIQLKIEDLAIKAPSSIPSGSNIGKEIVKKITNELKVDLQKIVRKSQAFLEKGNKNER